MKKKICIHYGMSHKTVIDIEQYAKELLMSTEELLQNFFFFSFNPHNL